jgi:hypothetical protein
MELPTTTPKLPPLPDVMLRRIVREMDKFNIKGRIYDNIYLHVPIVLHPSLQKRANKDKVEPTLIFTLSKYPWIPPTVYFNSINITRIYKCQTINMLQREINKIVGKSMCLCCESVLCRNNWVPTNTISTIIDEFHAFTQLKVRAVERILCNKIQERLFGNIEGGSILPLCDYAISEFL